MSFIQLSTAALAALSFVSGASGASIRSRCSHPSSNPSSLNITTIANTSTTLPLIAGAGAPKSSNVVASTYFAGFHANRGFPVASMPWEKYSDAKYAFAETSPDGSLDLSRSSPDQLPVFVAAAKKNNVKALLSIGGWTGSKYFSTSIGSAENRTTFVKTCLDAVDKYGLDGLDFDWEYPNRQGLGCNVINPNDTANFLAFLQELRQKQTKPLVLTAAGSLFAWNDAAGARSTNGALSGFADVLDYVMVMAYDIFGAWMPTGGPNAPLSYTCDATRNNQGGAEEGVASWISAGIPASKVVVAVGAYGHGFKVLPEDAFVNGTLSAYPKQTGERFQGSSWDDDPAVDDCGNPQPHGGTYTFWSMVTEGGFLGEDGKPREGIAYGYDSCSQTPFVYNNATQVWVSYDDATSLTAKGKYITEQKLAGFAMWEAGGDFKNIVVDAMRASVGL